MNILYVSNLTGNLFAGPNNSVPAQIRAQSHIDNVFWYNINNVKREEWKELNCYNIKDYPKVRLKDLPEPFNKPDIAVIEEFYCYPFCKIITDLKKDKIPYVIIPRSELTKKAQQRKKVKKIIGNLFYFKKMASDAVAIQYLSQQEKKDSGNKWNKNNFVIPNGINIPEKKRERFLENGINATYIGRYEIYQKGLDILIDAISNLQNILRGENFVLNMYGVNQETTIKVLKKKIIDNNIEDLIIINDAVYAGDKEEVLLNTDIFILTSRFEGMPMGVIEALAYGIPCFVTNGTNMVDYIKEYNAGWTAECSARNISEAIKNMLIDKDKIIEKGQNAKKLASNFEWYKIAEKSHEIYRELIKGDK